jgi:hypothetical protein
VTGVPGRLDHVAVERICTPGDLGQLGEGCTVPTLVRPITLISAIVPGSGSIAARSTSGQTASPSTGSRGSASSWPSQAPVENRVMLGGGDQDRAPLRAARGGPDRPVARLSASVRRR